MTTIIALAQDLVLTATLAPKLACNNRNTVNMRVTFSTEWQSFTARSAVYTTSVNPTPYEAVLAKGECTIPHEVLADAGLLYIYVKGVNKKLPTQEWAVQIILLRILRRIHTRRRILHNP